MNSRPSSSPASILRPVVFTLLAVVLLVFGALQSISAYPGPAALDRLAAALPAIWASIGFILGMALLPIGLLLLVGSAFWLRRRMLYRKVFSEERYSHQARASSAAPSHHPGEEHNSEPHPDHEDRYGDECEDYDGGYGYDNGYEPSPSRRRYRERARFEPRRWAGSAR